MSNTLGMISMRNEDGIQWLMEGGNSWVGDVHDGATFTMEQFQAKADTVAESRARDCPDNGFFGIYDLTYHEGKVPPVKTAEMLAAEAEWDAMFEKQFGTWEPEPDPIPTGCMSRGKQGESDIFDRLLNDMKREF